MDEYDDDLDDQDNIEEDDPYTPPPSGSIWAGPTAERNYYDGTNYDVDAEWEEQVLAEEEADQEHHYWVMNRMHEIKKAYHKRKISKAQFKERKRRVEMVGRP